MPCTAGGGEGSSRHSTQCKRSAGEALARSPSCNSFSSLAVSPSRSSMKHKPRRGTRPRNSRCIRTGGRRCSWPRIRPVRQRHVEVVITPHTRRASRQGRECLESSARASSPSKTSFCGRVSLSNDGKQAEQRQTTQGHHRRGKTACDRCRSWRDVLHHWRWRCDHGKGKRCTPLAN